ncbi:MAG: hypothetical protein DWQ04_15560 [Chloroflexi bacterium]|nr:MAG: hypothetical protein DWQ04_15560 [Chloroflexota bacterium]
MLMLHMETDLIRTVCNHIQQTAVSTQTSAQNLGNTGYTLANAWQGYSADLFINELQTLNQRLAQLAEDGLILSQRLHREIEEWEQVARQLNAGPLVWRAALLQSAGGGENRWLPEDFPGLPVTLPPLAFVGQLGGWSDMWPDWLKALMKPLLPSLQPPEPVPPVPMPGPTGSSRFGELLNEPVPQEPMPEAKIEAETAVSPTTDPSAPSTPTQTAPDVQGYPVPVKSQGKLGGSAACAPTSVSMILDYYHNQDGNNQTATPQELLNMLDKGDFSHGRGMSLNRITDELQDLGYTNVSAQVNTSQIDLQNQLQQGPVIATVRLDMQTNQLTATGSVVHAVVVKGVSENGQTVFINDPWTGSELHLPMTDFSATWKGGSNGMYVIRP